MVCWCVQAAHHLDMSTLMGGSGREEEGVGVMGAISADARSDRGADDGRKAGAGRRRAEDQTRRRHKVFESYVVWK